MACAPGEAPQKTDLSSISYEPEPGTLRRLTRAQYGHVVTDLLGRPLVVPEALEQDEQIDGLLSLGASVTTISSLGAERYERAALSLSSQVFGDPARREALVGCDVAGAEGQACLSDFLRTFGRRAFRRPLKQDELSRFVDVARSAGEVLGNPWEGLQYAVAGMLQSPHFLFRVEVGEDDPAGGGHRYGSFELASRLSFLLTNSTPDDELLDAAESGELLTDDGLRKQTLRLLDSPAGRRGIRAFFTELYRLGNLDGLVKDPHEFPHISADLGPAAREETLLLLEKIIFDDDGDFRRFFTGHETFVNRRLAALYDIPAPTADGFGLVQLPESGDRRGFLGQASFLALNSHPVSTSAVLRGMFVRTVLLCGTIPPPPADVNTGLPEPDATSPTLRERATVHMEDPACASCHRRMDPIGLGFENFDGIGRHRVTENGARIDPAGDLDGEPFAGPGDFADVLVNHRNFASCFATHLFRYANGRVEGTRERAMVQAMGEVFKESGWRVRSLIVDLVLSPGFRRAAEPQR